MPGETCCIVLIKKRKNRWEGYTSQVYHVTEETKGTFMQSDIHDKLGFQLDNKQKGKLTWLHKSKCTKILFEGKWHGVNFVQEDMAVEKDTRVFFNSKKHFTDVSKTTNLEWTTHSKRLLPIEVVFHVPD